MFRTMSAILASSLLAFEVSAQQDCGKVLEEAAYNQYDFMDRSSFTSSMFDAFCSESSSANTRYSDRGMTIPVKEIMFGFNDTQYRDRSRYNAFCRDRKNSFDYRAAITVAERIVDENAVRAWQRCVEAQSRGLQCFAEPIGSSSFNAKFRWTDRGFRSPEPVVLDEPLVTNATCRPRATLTSGAVLREATTDCAIQDVSEVATIAIETTQGVSRCAFEAAEPRKRTVELVEACEVSLNFESCRELKGRMDRVLRDCESRLPQSSDSYDRARRCAREIHLPNAVQDLINFCRGGDVNTPQCAAPRNRLHMLRNQASEKALLDRADALEFADD